MTLRPLRSLAISIAVAALASGVDLPARAQASRTGRAADCAPGAVRQAGIGVVVNNAWNSRSAGDGPWRQCLQSRQREGRTEQGWFWRWPSRDGLYAYPELLVGGSPWSSTPSNDARFPRSIADIRSLRIAYDIESTHLGKKNLALEFWLTDPTAVLADRANSVRAELMIVSDASPGLDPPTKTPAAIERIAGRDWAVQVRHHWGDASGGSAHTWTFITYRAIQTTSSIEYDARLFMQHAIDRQWIDARWTVEGIELGNEIVSGSGSTWVRRFDLAID